jgi:putative addiction module antidote
MASAVPSAVARDFQTRYNKRMNKPLKLIPIGNSTGVVIPKELLHVLGAEAGDSLFPVRTPAGIELRRSNSEFEAEMKLAREIMRRRRNVLRELAK